eukprot:1137225-Pelagomonas_calceolata.AAC.5
MSGASAVLIQLLYSQCSGTWTHGGSLAVLLVPVLEPVLLIDVLRGMGTTRAHAWRQRLRPRSFKISHFYALEPELRDCGHHMSSHMAARDAQGHEGAYALVLMDALGAGMLMP